MPEISHQQAEALATLRWLFSDEEGDRRTGRTFILALAYLRWAVEQVNRNPAWREWVAVEDHFLSQGVGRGRIVLTVIRQLAEDAGLVIEADAHRFRLVRAEAGHWVAAQRYLQEQFVETDIRLGLTDAQIEQFREMRVPPPHGQPARRRRNDDVATLRERVVEYVMGHPGQTATQIATALSHGNDAVASTLLKEVKAGNLERRPREGPRGGFTYYPKASVVGPSVWERVKNNPYVGEQHGDDEADTRRAGDPHEVWGR